MNEEIKNEIQKLKKEKDAVILAHYYVDGEVQELSLIHIWNLKRRFCDH